MTTDRSDNESTDARESAVLYRLMSWLSPAYPVGAFSYSGGLEWVVEAGDVKDPTTLADWLGSMITNGSVFCDAVFFVHAHTASRVGNDEALRAVAELASAFASSKERHLETTAQGRAFMDATLAAWPCDALTRLEAIWRLPPCRRRQPYLRRRAPHSAGPDRRPARARRARASRRIRGTSSDHNAAR
jgi:urease accessory protein